MEAEKSQSALRKQKAKENWQSVANAYEQNWKYKFQFKFHGLMSNSIKSSGAQLSEQAESNSTLFNFLFSFGPQQIGGCPPTLERVIWLYSVQQFKY